MSSQSVKDKIRVIVRDKSVNFNVILRQYMYERFVERVAVSQYKFNFIFKGGYYLSTIFGVYNRMTMDIDACLKNTKLSKENLLKIVNEIISIDIFDGATFFINEISLIRDEDEYGGYRVSLTVKIDQMKESFHLDVVTGDSITPKEIKYKYISVIGDKQIQVLAYNLETVLAEKLETVLSKNLNNSRMKDFYDIYLLMTFKKDSIDKDILEKAIRNTFKKRNFHDDVLTIFKEISNSKLLESKWIGYARRKNIKNISYQDTISAIYELVKYSSLIFV